MNLAALDIGTNSFHMVVARPAAGGGFETLTRAKEVVRLGSGGGDMKLLTPDAIDRGVACLARMRDIAASHDAVVRAVATSATREAVNSLEFIERAAAEAGVDVEVISGPEEARLIHLGVLQAVPVFDRRLLLIDVGGGSTELLLGECGETLAARSFKLGAVRLTDRHFPGGEVTPKAVKACRSQIRGVVEHFHHDVDRFGFEVAIASSGTAETVARMAHLARGSANDPLRTYNCFEFTTAELDAVLDELTGHRTAAARVKLPGLEAARADIIVAGALILSTVAETFGIPAFTYSEAALREGVLLDMMSRSEHGARDAAAQHLRDVSRRSINKLVERCDDDPDHSRHVAGLAVALFDALPELHDLPGRPREYLEAAALLANVGLVIAHSKHHLHGYYIIRNSELAGLTDGEIELIAQVARYHRKSEPKSSHAAFAALGDDDQRLVRTLAGVLRVAIGLDRRHERRVHGVAVDRSVTDGPLRLVLDADDDVSLETFAADERKGLLEQVLGRPIEIVTGEESSA